MSITYSNTEIETPIQAGLEEQIEHGIVVSGLAYLVGKELGLSEEMCYDLSVAGVVHDIGKVKLNTFMNENEERILAVDETRYLRMHPTVGYSILIEQGDFNQNVLDAVLYHHEHYDGTGYPLNLKGEEIPLLGRIMHVCDVFGALVSNRVYRERFDVETALNIMVDDAKNFDMRVYLAFQRVAFSDEMQEFLKKNNLNEIKEEEE